MATRAAATTTTTKSADSSGGCEGSGVVREKERGKGAHSLCVKQGNSEAYKQLTKRGRGQ